MSEAPQDGEVSAAVGSIPDTAPAPQVPAPVEPALAAPAPPDLPRVQPGDIVLYCLPSGTYPGAWRPALVLKEWSPGCVQLAVFPDFSNDGLPCPLWASSVTYGADPGRWRPRVHTLAQPREDA